MNRRILLIGAAVLVVIVVAWFFLLWRPAGDDLDEANERLDDARARNSQLAATIARLEAQEEERPRLQSDLEALRAAIPAEADQADLQLGLNEAAEASGVELLSLTYNAAAGEGQLQSIGVQMGGEGGYFQLLDFLNRVSALHRIVVIDGLNISSTATESDFGPPDLTFQMNARAFVASSDPLAGGGDGTESPDTPTEGEGDGEQTTTTTTQEGE